jgi:hypothetical protein
MKVNFRNVITGIAFVFLHCLPASAQYDEIDSSVVITKVDADEDGESKVSELREDDRKPLELRKVNRQDVENIRNDKDFWYVDEMQKKEKKKAEPPAENWFGKLLRTNWFEPLMWIVVIGSFVGILIWFLSTMDVSIFRKKAKRISDNSEEETPENIFEIDFEKAITAAVNARNLRLAVRLMYLQLLKELSEKNIIRYNPQRPNSEYVMQLYGTSYYPEFFSITRNFEYAWYGGFHVSAVAYEKIRAEVSGLKTRIA